MLRLITSQVCGDTLGMIYSGKISTTSVWVETTALLVREIHGDPFGRYFQIVITSDFTEDDAAELDRLEEELGKKLADCVVEREMVEEPHPFFPGSRYFTLVMVYGG